MRDGMNWKSRRREIAQNHRQARKAYSEAIRREKMKEIVKCRKQSSA